MKTLRSIGITCSFALILALMTGCVTRYSGARNPQTIHEDQYDQAYEAALETLDQLNWPILQAGYSRGVITAGPMPIPTLLEPFSKANTSNQKQLRATLHDERAITTILIEKLKDKPELYALRVQVDIQRLSEPRKRLSGATQGHAIFSKLSKVPHEWQVRGISDPSWDIVDRDTDLQQLILHKIMSKVLDSQPISPKTAKP